MSMYVYERVYAYLCMYVCLTVLFGADICRFAKSAPRFKGFPEAGQPGVARQTVLRSEKQTPTPQYRSQPPVHSS